MSHKDAGIFQAYINERIQCDVQAAFLGRPSADAILKSVSHMSRDVDPHAPTKLTDNEVDSLKTHPLIVELKERRDTLSKEARRMHGTLKKAEAAGSMIHELYQQATSDLEQAKKRLSREKLQESRAEFFDRIETEDARRQLGLLALDLKEDEWKPPEIEHTLVERRSVAELLCEPPSEPTPKERTKYRANTINALVSLCWRKEVAQKPTGRSHDWGILPTPEPSPKASPEPFPIFCVCRTGQPRRFCRPRKVREHVERQHLVFFGLEDLIPCPDEHRRLSGIVLFGHLHFKNHVSRVHGCSLLPYTLK
jgi:hypothetical protein